MCGFGAGQAVGEVATLNGECALLQVPLAIVRCHCQLLGSNLKFDRRALARCNLDLLEIAQTACIRNNRRNIIIDKEQHALLAATLADVLDIDSYADCIARLKLLPFNNSQVAILERGVRQSVAKCPLRCLNARSAS